jgi:hypothetical protein
MTISKRSLLAAISIILMALLCACTSPAQSTSNPSLPQTSAPPAQAVTPAQNAQATPVSAQDALATREAALQNSGRTGPTLPSGNVSISPEPPTPTPTSLSIQAEPGNIYPAGQSQSTPGASLPSLSPAEQATRDAALQGSSKPGPTQTGETGAPGSNCLRGVGLIFFSLGWLVVRKRILAG